MSAGREVDGNWTCVPLFCLAFCGLQAGSVELLLPIIKREKTPATVLE